MDPSEISPEYELTVRNHIRQTFLPYVRKHITRDHVAYTEFKIEQIFTESLDFVPLADPHALVLPPDPLDALAKYLEDLDLSVDERYTTDGETVRKLKLTLKTIVGEGRELRSETCWQEDDYMYTHLADIYRPMTPILTNRARKQTPKPGSNVLRASLPRSQPALFEHIGVKSIIVEKIEEPDVPNLEEVLNLRPTIDTTTRSYMLSLFKSANPPAQSTETNVHVNAFLRANSPPLQIRRPFSPPLFPRSRASSGSLGTGIANAKDIVDRLNTDPVPVLEELEDDIDEVNMTIVDGWAILPISSPPSASPLSSQDTEIDELWEASPTPSGTPATSLFNARMDEVEIPRIHKPGNALPYTSKLKDPKRLKSLLEHLKPVASAKPKQDSSTTPTKKNPKIALLLSSLNAEDGRSLDAEDSMLGQPPSVCAVSPLTSCATRDRGKESDQDLDLDDIEIDGERDLDMSLRHMYREVQEENIERCVLEERLDEKDVALMDVLTPLHPAVPHLPPPTVHPGPSIRPTSMRALIRGGKVNTVTNANVPRHTTLESVKGIKPLNLELSWRPFKFTPPVPTDESVSVVDGLALDDLEKLGYTDKASVAKIRGLLEDLEAASSHSANVAGCKNLDDRDGAGNFGLSPPRPPKSFLQEEGFELVLTKRERRLLAGLPEFEDPQENRTGYGEDRQERQDELKDGDEASLVTKDNQPTDHPVLVFRDYDVLDDDPGVNHSDVVDNGVSGGATFDDPGVVFNDSGVTTPILHNNEADYQDQGVLRYLGAAYSPEDVDYSDEDNGDDFHYVQLQGQQQERDQRHDQGPSLLLSTRHQHSPSSYSVRHRRPREHDQDPAVTFHPQNNTEIGFFPLSFGSQMERASRYPTGSSALLDGDEERSGMLPDNERPNNIQDISDKDNLANVSSFLQYFVLSDLSATAPASKRRRLDDPSATTIATRDLDDHLALRNKPVTYDPPPPTTPATMFPQPQALQLSSTSPPRAAPPEILDTHTIRLPDIWNPPTTGHCYLASMALIQKRALVRVLQDPEYWVHLVERYVLGGVDIVMDPDTAVLVAPLLALPSQVEGLADRISEASWRYTHILVILEAFPSANAFTAENNTNSSKLTPYAFSPPMLKAVKKLRRLLSIAEGCGTKNAGCEVQWAFANDVDEAALFVRMFGNMAQERAFHGSENALWEDRGWLQVDEHEDEADLGSVEGMNPFAAFVMLYQSSLQEILDMSPDKRVAEFSSLVGSQRIASLNAIIEQRTQEMDVDAATESGMDCGGMGGGMNDSARY
ncbi:uncharacterized protein EDB91DRAFT_1252534 [Suillus paluster]|uniref:uncharacterized protein n=1 Tax=Suillus paluster TaxID=48578 RepID=UPI001B860222|nr:uncharacterized protein EDB91DRAFT_1252534 [Suillus paluster]KAG1730675.1 hypothetical protein EDB91DRAFT_1252534 [Suillus paluster]